MSRRYRVEVDEFSAGLTLQRALLSERHRGRALRTCRRGRLRTHVGRRRRGSTYPFSRLLRSPNVCGAIPMASIGSLLMLDYRVDELRERIKIESERVAQMEIEGREPSKSRKCLASLEQSLEAMLVQREKIVRELESGRPANFRRAVG